MNTCTCALVRMCSMSIIGLAIYFLSPAAHARSTHLIEAEPVTINCHLPAEEMNEAILKGGAARKWVAIEQMKGVTELKYVKGNNKHILTVEVSYTADTFAITYKDHQCSAIPAIRGFKCLTKRSIIATSDLPVIIAFCRERMVNEHMRAIRAWKNNRLTKRSFSWAISSLLSSDSAYFLSDG